jgi:hypothetical protein
MKNLVLITLLVLVAVGCVDDAAATGRAEAGTCTVNTIPKLPDVRISSTTNENVPAPHCRVIGVIGTEIGFELRLPKDWNGKFIMGGGGGFAGNFANAAHDFWNVVENGWATVATDTGHKGHALSASWALNNLERQVSFGHMAAHRTAVTAKAIIEDFYGRPSSRDLFYGCSRGGGQALMMAQRSPDLFDAIYAGAPAYSWTTEMAGRWTRNAQFMFPDPNKITSPVIDTDALTLIGNEVMKQCDAIDGLKDGILNDPRQCKFDVASLGCSAGSSNQCLTPKQVAAAQAIYGDFKIGGKISRGTPVGAELPGNPLGWGRWITGGYVVSEEVEFHPGMEDDGFEAPTAPNARWGFTTELMKYFFYSDPNWTYRNYDFSDFAHHAARLATTLDADNPDLSKFRANGGKLIIDNGWMDGSLSAYGTLDYYKSVLVFDKTAREDVRLFLRPGVTHCQGGPGPDGTNYIAALEAWLGSGVAPEQLDAPFVNPMTRKPTGSGRIICAHPGVVTYDGNGDPKKPASFSCQSPR